MDVLPYVQNDVIMFSIEATYNGQAQEKGIAHDWSVIFLIRFLSV
ncbi:hypothetical protein SAMN04488100_12529 [Alkalibacterium putridalgicola]|uniref:Uncharacterized protein n=1 Tax=Alkalibacterium putridalgicola TaxID=426703 RepID=A0A1H7VLT3_9LACT|nr:hypothetical protein [Alkalibacterium putridalgicola]SEM09994.1 hypothetical protein SAMN04488100_12529 [Alkalibacterium putridalgicola]